MNSNPPFASLLRIRIAVLLALGALLFLASISNLSAQQNGTWISNAAANWGNTSTAWSGNLVATGAGATANITANITSARTITQNLTTLTLGTLNIGDTNNSHAYTISGNFITMNSSSGSAGTAINFLTGSAGDTISSNLTIGDIGGLTINNTSTRNSTISGVISTTVGAGVIINSSGTGRVNLTAVNSFSGNLTILSGTVNGTVAGAFGSGAILLGDTGGSNNATLTSSLAGTHTNNITVRSGSSGTLSITGVTNNTTFSGTVALNNNLTLDHATSGNRTLLSGAITQDSTARTITKGTGAGTVEISGATTLGSGGLTLANSGSAVFTHSGGITGTGDLTLRNNSTGASGITISSASVNNTGTITNSGSGTGSVSISGGVGSNVTNITQNSSTSNLTVGAIAMNSAGTTLVNNQSGSTANLSVTGGITGTGDLTLNNNSSTASGITISTASVNNTGTITNSGSGTGSVTISGGVGSNVSRITQNSSTSNLTVGAIAMNSAGTTLVNNQSGSTANLSVTGGITGTGDLTLNNNSSTASGITISTASVNNTGTITNSGSGTGSVTISGGVGSNVTNITQNSATSALTLNGTSSNTGNININAGTLQFATRASLYNATTADWTASKIKVGSGGTLMLSVNGTGQFGTGDVTTLLANLGGANGGSSGGFAAGSAIGFDAASAFTVGDNIADTTGGGGGAIGLTKLGTGNLTLTGSNTYTGATTITAATLAIATTGQLGGGSYAGNIVNNGTFLYNGTNSQTLSGVISGTGVLTKNNASSALTLSGNNTYSGGTALSAGTLNINHANALGGGTLTISGGTIDNTSGAAITNAGNNAIALNSSFAFGGTNDLNLGTGAVTGDLSRTITLSGSGKTLTLGGNWTNTVNGRDLIVNGNGTLSMGGLVINSNQFDLVNNANVTVTGALTDGSGTSKFVIQGNGTTTLNAAGSTTADIDLGVVTAGINPIVRVGNNALGSGNVTLQALTLQAVNGDVTLANNMFLRSATISGNNNLTLSGNFTQTNSNTLISSLDPGKTLVFSGNVFLSNNSTVGRTLTISGTGATLISGNISNFNGSGQAGSLTIGNTGTVTLSGTNTYTGTTTLTAGTMIAGNKAAFGSGTLSLNGSTLQANTDLSGANAITNNVSLTATSTISGSNNMTFSGTWTNTGATGRTLNSSLDAGKTLLIAGPVNLTDGNGNYGTFIINGTGDTTISGNITPGLGITAPTTGLQIGNTGTTRLSGSNTYSGRTNLYAGVTVLDSANALPSTSNLVLNGGVLGLGTGSSSFTRALGLGNGEVTWRELGGNSLQGGFAAYGANAVVNLGGTSTQVTWGTNSFLSNGTTAQAGWTFILGASSADKTVDFQNPISLGTSGTNTRTVRVDNGSAAIDAILSGVISGDANQTFSKTGLGTLALNATNTYSGATIINAGTLQIGTGGSTGSLNATSTITNNGTLAFNRSTNVVQGTDFSSAAISGSGSLVQSGAATLTLSAANSYTGGTTINAGTIALSGASGALGSGDVVLGASTALELGNTGTPTVSNNMSGSGTIRQTGSGVTSLSGTNTNTGAVEATAGTLLFSGAGALSASTTSLNASNSATLSFADGFTRNSTIAGNINLSGSSFLKFDINGASSDFLSTESGTASLTGSGKIQLNLLSAPTSATTYNLLKAGGGLSSSWTLDTNSFAAGAFTWSLSTSGNNTLQLVAAASQTNTYWTGSTSGDWSALANWAANSDGTGAGVLPQAGYNVFFDSATPSGTLATTLGGQDFTLSQLAISKPEVTINGSNTLNVTTSSVTAINISATGNTTINANLAGAAGLTKSASGTLTLGGSNTYTGGTTLTDGTLNINNSGSGGTSSAIGTGTLTITGGTIDNTSGSAVTLSTNNTQNWNGDFAFTGTRDLNLGTGAVNMSASRTVTVNDANLTVGGIIGGNTFGLTKNGQGTLTLSGANTYTGGTTLTAGTLNINNSGSGGTSSAIGTGALTITGGTIDNTSGSAVTLSTNNTQNWNGDFAYTGTRDLNLGTGAVSMNANRIVTVNGGNLTVGGAISGTTATFSLTKDGAGTLLLGGNNTYTGATTINAGTLRTLAANLISNASAVSVASGATFVVGGSDTVASIAGAGNITLSAGTLTTNQTTNTLLSGVISGTGNLTKSGTGTLTLSGSNTYNGTTTINGGTLLVGHDNALGNSSLTITDAAIASDSAADRTLNNRINAFTVASVSFGTAGTGNLTFTNTTTTSLNTGAVTFTINNAVTQFNAGIGQNTGTRILIKNGAGTLILNGANSYLGNTTISAGTLQIGAGGMTGSLSTNSSIINNATLTFNRSADTTQGTHFSNNITGTGNLIQAGSGTLFLGGTNSYTGLTTISAGNLSINATTAVGSTSGINLANNTTLIYTGGSAATLDRAISVTGGTGTIRNNGGELTLSGGLTKNGTTLILDSGTFNVNTIGISGSAANSDLVIDGATVNLNVANTYNGPTSIIDGGTLNANVTDALPTANGRTAISIDATGTGSSTLALGASQSIASLTGAASSNVTLGSHTLTVGTTSGSTTYAGSITGTGNLVKDGASTQVLSGANTFNGTTTVNGTGTLTAATANALGGTTNIDVNGGSLLVAVANAVNSNANINLGGGTLAVSGNFNQNVGALTLSADSVIDFSGFAGTLRFSGLSWASGATNATLAIWNWSGTTDWGTHVNNYTNPSNLVFTSNANLTAENLAKISFYSDSGNSFVGKGFIDSDFAGPGTLIIAVPEPETVITAVVLLLGFGIYQIRLARQGEGLLSRLTFLRSRPLEGQPPA